MQIFVKFNPTTSPEEKAITLIAYLEFDNLLEITKSRQILCNYQ